MSNLLFKSALLSLGTCAAVSASAQIQFLSGVNVTRGGEIVSFDRSSASLLVTNSFAAAGLEDHKISIFSMNNAGVLSGSGSVNLNGLFGGAANILSVSSVAADPLGRDFGVATVIPKANNTTLGVVALFQLSTGTLLNTLDVGYHPDSVTFTPDGSRLVIANEGEYVTAGPQVAGSVSIVNVSSVGAGASGVAALSAAHVTDVNFSSSLGAGVSINGLRNNRLDTLTTKTSDALDIEPEYVNATNDKAYVTLQEANGIAVVDLTGANAGQVTAIHQLGVINQTIDASDRDGAGGTASASVNDVVAAMPTPDGVTSFVRGGQRLLATANEGDFRTDDADRIRLRDARNTAAITDPNITTGMANNAVLGRLRISSIDGDTDSSGKIDRPTMLGSRSFSIWDSETGALVFDSGSLIEQWVIANDPTTHNIELGNVANFDLRSDDKGPELEGITFATIDGRDFLFAVAERQNGVFQFDITNLSNVFVAGYYNTVSGVVDDGQGAFVAPESIQFIPASASPTGKDMLIVGYEGEYDPVGGIDIAGSVAVFTVIPEPATWAGLLGAVALACAALRRRKA